MLGIPPPTLAFGDVAFGRLIERDRLRCLGTFLGTLCQRIELVCLQGELALGDELARLTEADHIERAQAQIVLLAMQRVPHHP